MKLVPPIQVIEKFAQSPAEVQVARALQRADMHATSVAYWSVRLTGHATKPVAEADFVVVDGDALLVIEVKGGRVSRVDGEWTSLDRYGQAHRLPESPMQQARGAGWALQKRIGADGRYFVRWGAMVITPDLPIAPRSIEWDAGAWLAGPDLARERFVDLLGASFSSIPPAPPQWQGKIATGSHLKTALDATFDGEPTYNMAAAILDEQNDATASQAEALARFYTHQLIVTGGAGTGKTLVMAELARKEAESMITGQEQPAVLATFRSPSLTPYISSLLDGVAGVTVKPFADLTADEMYDVILVDEAQDLMNAQDMDILTGALRGGLDDGRWRLFLDPNNQAHVDGLYDEETFEVLRAQASAQLPLDKNVRNTRPVVNTLKAILQADVGDPGIVNGEPPFWDLQSSGDLKAALRRARSLVAQGTVSSEICLVDCSSDVQSAERTPEGYLLASPASIKGLEANHVIVFGWPATENPRGRAAAYVALTRPRVSLSVLLTPAQSAALSDLAKKGATHAAH
ncbi:MULTISPECIES: nuclease-related domain-containing DEAD/DEAH box helicase [Micrococcus]|uniref:nuclease-related domain-containing DEAD/DEAH box helicase n=1 Tax=Micrococcus luteus TaxID=1270 RepID=UPI0019CFF335|nr:NERD domain-containing protein/DEAD/DEAH box helicase [Micrococcus luteus]MBN6767059.1 NERD domain-containing protein/DEAD/DEAH box helicase [Micrococcus luteus]MBN6827351.1 NERD domain-containing protein/DEAD/DEAH box helicase [Micrococcus luteus]MBN6845457.1 NERD domain-containing protein/DEAD/DEAH box helicase [Micrococcus luteus]MBN6861604.1 NERD domain-containing protein/DEAD/DEAH box helicase [Micrococcus luteus]MBN6863526.1 NERD domain-containing protein/DEAD/DEAH box helicase [Micro